MQTIYYLGRPHEGVVLHELDIPSSWKGAELAARKDTVYTFSLEEQAELMVIVKDLTESGTFSVLLSLLFHFQFLLSCLLVLFASSISLPFSCRCLLMP